MPFICKGNDSDGKDIAVPDTYGSKDGNKEDLKLDMIMLGPPGSGKGTQGNLLAEQLHARHLSTGELFREILQDASHPLYPQLQVIKEGKLVSDEVVNLVVEDGIQKPEYQGGVAFDGYPRTIAQAKALERILASMSRKVDLVIDLDVSREVLFFRILGRQICPKCKQIFHEQQGLKNCSNCGEALVYRSDDNEETIVKRLQEYEVKTAPLRDYYRDSQAEYVTLSITDASLTAQDVNQQILELLKQRGIVQGEI